jgi:hypothetical protein
MLIWPPVTGLKLLFRSHQETLKKEEQPLDRRRAVAGRTYAALVDCAPLKAVVSRARPSDAADV